MSAVRPDPHLSALARRVAAALADEQYVSAGTMQEWTADERVPWIVDTVRWGDDARCDEDPLRAVGAGRARGMAVCVSAARDVELLAPYPAEGGELALRVVAPWPRVALVSIDPSGVTATTAEPVDGVVRFSLAAPGWYELSGRDDGRSGAVAVVRVGPPIPLAPTGLDPRAAIVGGLGEARATLGAPPFTLVDGVPECGSATPDVLGGIEVTHDQKCTTYPFTGRAGDLWNVLLRRPATLADLVNPGRGVLQLGVDGGELRIRTANRFVRYTDDEATRALYALAAARWPAAEVRPSPELRGVVERWVAAADPFASIDAVIAELDPLGAAWTPDPRYVRVAHAAQSIALLLDTVGDADVRHLATAVMLGAGPSGEPMYYSATLLGVP